MGDGYYEKRTPSRSIQPLPAVQAVEMCRFYLRVCGNDAGVEDKGGAGPFTMGRSGNPPTIQVSPC
jgi:hypothetical protein